jgi:hypothetical protein
LEERLMAVDDLNAGIAAALFGEKSRRIAPRLVIGAQVTL